MKNEHTNQEITWKTESIYIDIETGEIITQQQAKEKYIITKKIKQSYVYRKTGTVKYTNECRPNQQGRLFE